jgi:hypothetical protein
MRSWPRSSRTLQRSYGRPRWRACAQRWGGRRSPDCATARALPVPATSGRRLSHPCAPASSRPPAEANAVHSGSARCRPSHPAEEAASRRRQAGNASAACHGEAARAGPRQELGPGAASRAWTHRDAWRRDRARHRRRAGRRSRARDARRRSREARARIDGAEATVSSAERRPPRGGASFPPMSMGGGPLSEGLRGTGAAVAWLDVEPLPRAYGKAGPAACSTPSPLAGLTHRPRPAGPRRCHGVTGAPAFPVPSSAIECCARGRRDAGEPLRKRAPCGGCGVPRRSQRRAPCRTRARHRLRPGRRIL